MHFAYFSHTFEHFDIFSISNILSQEPVITKAERGAGMKTIAAKLTSDEGQFSDLAIK